MIEITYQTKLCFFFFKIKFNTLNINHNNNNIHRKRREGKGREATQHGPIAECHFQLPKVPNPILFETQVDVTIRLLVHWIWFHLGRLISIHKI